MCAIPCPVRRRGARAPVTISAWTRKPRHLPVEPAAAKLGIPVKFLREQVRDQQIPHIVIGRRVLIPVADASRVLEGNPLELSRSLVDTPRGFNSRVALGVVFAAPPVRGRPRNLRGLGSVRHPLRNFLPDALLALSLSCLASELLRRNGFHVISASNVRRGPAARDRSV